MSLLNWFFKSSRLRGLLQSRPDADQLNRMNLIPVVAVGISPLIAAKTVRLEKELRKDSLGKKLKTRPDADQIREKLNLPARVSPRLLQKSVKLSRELRRVSLSKRLDERESLESVIDSGILIDDPRK
jgi:hypothetical protein